MIPHKPFVLLMKKSDLTAGRRIKAVYFAPERMISRIPMMNAEKLRDCLSRTDFQSGKDVSKTEM